MDENILNLLSNKRPVKNLRIVVSSKETEITTKFNPVLRLNPE